jgi:hypothetical protein
VRRKAGTSFGRAPRTCSLAWIDGSGHPPRKGVTRQHTLFTRRIASRQIVGQVALWASRAGANIRRSAQGWPTSHSHRRPLDSATEPRQAGHSKMFPAVAARDAVLCLESSNCSDVPPAANPTGSLLRGTHQDGLQRARTPGRVEHHPEEPITDRWGSSSRYGASLRRENGQIIRRFQSRVFSASLGLDRAFCSEPSCGSARSGWLPSSASSRL